MKLFLVDDHPMLLKGLRQAILEQPSITVVGEATTGADALQRAAELNPDIIVMDIHLPDISGLEVTRKILALLPSAKVLVFSADPNRTMVDEALQAGACGYIWKQSAVDEVLRAIEMVQAGKLYLSPELSTDILKDYRNVLFGAPAPSRPLLSERDKLMLRLIAEGRRNKEIAQQLGVSAKSVESYRSRLMKRLGCPSAAELIRYAIREGIAAP
jgi:DNA-binding NarL/FixJ family response regulator